MVACKRQRARGSPPWAGRSGASTCGATGHGPPLPKSCEHCRSDGTVVRATIGRLAGILENPRRCWRIADVLGDAQGRSIWINSEGSAGGCLASYAIGTTFEGHEHGAAAQPAQSVVVTRESDKAMQNRKVPTHPPKGLLQQAQGTWRPLGERPQLAFKTIPNYECFWMDSVFLDRRERFRVYQAGVKPKGSEVHQSERGADDDRSRQLGGIERSTQEGGSVNDHQRWRTKYGQQQQDKPDTTRLSSTR